MGLTYNLKSKIDELLLELKIKRLLNKEKRFKLKNLKLNLKLIKRNYQILLFTKSSVVYSYMLNTSIQQYKESILYINELMSEFLPDSEKL